MCQAIICSLYFFVSSKIQTLLQFPPSFIFVNVISVLQFIFYTYWNESMKHYLFNYLLFTKLHKYSIVQNFKEPMKATEIAVDIVLDVLKNSHRNV